jgi:hypothetical protein
MTSQSNSERVTFEDRLVFDILDDRKYIIGIPENKQQRGYLLGRRVCTGLYIIGWIKGKKGKRGNSSIVTITFDLFPWTILSCNGMEIFTDRKT